MTTYTPSQLPSTEWKPCTICDGSINGIRICKHCSGTGKEPVEMKNLPYDCGDQDCKEKHPNYKHQVGVEFEIWADAPFSKLGSLKYRYRFLPLRQKVEGDNSILMVVPQ